MARQRTSAELIRTLRQRGWTDSAIGKALQRDSSLVHQIAKGKKPGRNLRQSLGELLRSGKVTTKPERKRQRTRQGRNSQQTPAGRVQGDFTATTAADMARFIRKSRARIYIQADVTWEDSRSTRGRTWLTLPEPIHPDYLIHSTGLGRMGAWGHLIALLNERAPGRRGSGIPSDAIIVQCHRVLMVRG